MASATDGLHQIEDRNMTVEFHKEGAIHGLGYFKSVLIEVSLKGTGQPRKRLPEVCFC